MKETTLIEIQEAVSRFEAHRFAQPIQWAIEEGQHWAIVGPNGGGKSLLIDILLERQALLQGRVKVQHDAKVREVVKYVTFNDIYSFIDVRNSFYQQRWNAGLEESAMQVREFFEGADTAWMRRLMDVFAIDQLMDKRVNMLSSGELRKTLIILSLLSKPRLLILDNPYIGLDVKSRGVLNEMLAQLATLDHVQVATIVSQVEDIAPVITHVLPIREKTLLPVCTAKEFGVDKDLHDRLFVGTAATVKVSDVAKHEKADFENVLIFNNVDIKYGTRTILNEMNWHVRKGEKWLLWGENGSGKSTMMGLIYGDNPQAYARDIILFDRRRGTGESIWDIKKRIGYISPEIALYYRKNITCLDVVLSGFFDIMGSPRKCSDEQVELALRWMNIFGIEHLRDSSSLNVSVGERQLALLARAFVKSPDLLLLDEPMHGLDAYNKQRVLHVIKEYCTSEKSMIYITHYEDEIPNVMTDRLVLVKNK